MGSGIPLDRHPETCDGWSIRIVLGGHIPSFDSHDRLHPDQDSPVPPVVFTLWRLEEPTAMLHFSCDICGKDLSPDDAARFVVKMEAFAATDPAQLTDDDLSADHVEEMAQLLSEIEDGDAAAPELLPACKKMRFDLCPLCYRKFVKDPLGREAAARLNFSEN